MSEHEREEQLAETGDALGGEAVPDPHEPGEPTQAEPPPPAGDTDTPDYQDLYLRAAAETENVRKRARRDVEQANARGVARLARELLPALDNLERALEAAEQMEGEGDHPITKGIRLVQQELTAGLTRVGIEAFTPAGEQFDPHQHDAVAQVPADGVASGTITNVVQTGYRYRDEILRHAKVTVAP